MKAIINGNVILKDRVLENHAVVVDQKIIDILETRAFTEKYKSEDIEVLDAMGNYISPGFVDVHIHGAMGKDAMDGEESSLEVISAAIAENGVTSFLPTTMTMDKETIHRALGSIRGAMNKRMPGANVIGAHLEGPFINPKKRGAQNPEYIHAPSYEFIEDYVDVIKIITLAPEMDKNFEFMKRMKGLGIALSMGHSNATYDEAIEAIDHGVKSTTHLFNGMTGLNHRNPGVVGAALTTDIYSELIADTVHVHKDLFPMLAKVKTADRLVLITDAVRATCLKPGKYDLGGQAVFVDECSSRLSDGSLAGSVLKFNEAIERFMAHGKVTIEFAVRMGTLTPASLIGIDKEKGSIEIGKDADITVFAKDYAVKLTMVEGSVVYRG